MPGCFESRLNDCALPDGAENGAQRLRVPARRGSRHCPELSMEVTLVAVAERHRNRGQPVAAAQEYFRSCYAHLLEIRVRRQAGDIAERSTEMESTQTRDGRQLGHAWHLSTRIVDADARHFSGAMAAKCGTPVTRDAQLLSQ